jgi:hypothetical protein
MSRFWMSRFGTVTLTPKILCSDVRQCTNFYRALSYGYTIQVLRFIYIGFLFCRYLVLVTYRNTQQQHTTQQHNIKPLSRRKGQDCMPFSSSVTGNFSCHSESRGRMVGLCCCCFVQRWSIVLRPSYPSSHVFQLTQKATLFHRDNDFCVTTLFHHDSDCCVTSTVDCSFVLVILVSSSSPSSSSFRHGLRASFWFSSVPCHTTVVMKRGARGSTLWITSTFSRLYCISSMYVKSLL